MKITEV